MDWFGCSNMRMIHKGMEKLLGKAILLGELVFLDFCRVLCKFILGGLPFLTEIGSTS